MLRLAAGKCLTQGYGGAMKALSTASKSKVVLGSLSGKNVLRSFVVHPTNQPNKIAWRTLSSDAPKDEKKGSEQKAEDGSEETQIVLTPGQKVVAYSRLGMWAGIFAFACACAFYIGRELFPT